MLQCARGELRYCWYSFQRHCTWGIENSKKVVPLVSCNHVVGVGYMEGLGGGVDVCVLVVLCGCNVEMRHVYRYERLGVGKGLLGEFCPFPYCCLKVSGVRMWVPMELMMPLMAVSC